MTTPSEPTRQQLERLLHAEIPLTRAMGVTVAGFDALGLTLTAPLAPNINHQDTAFGGSLATLATLAGWGLLQITLRDLATVTVVIQECRIEYLRPVTADFAATCRMPDSATLEQLRARLQRKGVARVTLDVTIGPAQRPAVRFQGRYVAYAPAALDRADSMSESPISR